MKLIKSNLIILAMFLLLLVGNSKIVSAQTYINGILKDIGNDEPIEKVNIKNVHTGEIITTNTDGLFRIAVKRDELLTITHVSYETITIRIANEKNPSYYNLIMRPKNKRLMEIIVREKNPIYSADSAQTYETYKLILEKPGPEDLNASNAVMANMSKKFRQEQAFKENYNKWEKAKFINYMFNPKNLQKWTGLSGDSLNNFIELYRPSYEFLRTANDYQYLNYIKTSLKQYCQACEFKR